MGTIGARVKKARQYFNEKQLTFANRLEIHRSQLSDIENDKKEPPKTLLTKMHIVYGINRDWIMTGLGEMIVNPTELSIEQFPLMSDEKLLEIVLIKIEDYLYRTKKQVSPITKVRLIITFCKYFSNNRNWDEKEMRRRIEISIDLVATAIKENGNDRN
jgi:transcriptional regulator with XRE-family HTH domain